MTVYRNLGFVVLASGMCTAAPGLAQAQQAGAAPRAIEEIVVTARKREESIRDVPLAITAFTADEMARRNIEGLTDVARFTAGFSFENFGGGSSPAPIIRGLTQTTLTDRNQNVGTFVDGVHVQQQGNIDMALMDVERIEVLKGPQNAQYGRSAFAGAINYVARKAELGVLGGNAGFTFGTDERLDFRGSLNLPLWEDKLALRISGAKTEFDGTWSNNFSGGDSGIATTDASFGNSFKGTDGNVGGWDNDAVQAQLRFVPTDDIRIDLSYFKSNVDNEQGAVQFIRPNSVSIFGLGQQTNCNPSQATGVLRFVCGKLDFDPDTLKVDPRSVGLQAETQLLSGRIEWQLADDLVFTYLVGRNDLDQNVFGHNSNPPNPEFGGCGFTGGTAPPCAGGDPGVLLFVTGPTTQKATSHEFRVDGNAFGDALGWRLGYYHSEVEDRTFVNSVETRRSLLTDPGGQVVVNALPAASATTFKDETDAFFGAISYGFADIYTLDVEARYAAEKRAQTSGQLPPRTFYDFTPRVSLKAQVTPDWMAYGSVAKGSKSGGFNTPTADPGFETFTQETNWTYEIGAKQVLLQDRLELNYNVFYIDWEDLQLPTADLVPVNPDSPTNEPNFTVNASGASSYGAELELVAYLTDQWRLNFAGSWARPEFDGDALDFGIGAQCAGSSAAPVCPFVTVQRPGRPDAFAAEIGGNQLSRTPTVQLAGGLEYSNVMARGWEYAIRSDVSYQDKQYAEVLNLAYLPERTLVDLNVTFVSPARDWRVSLWGKNVLDETYAANSFVIAFANNYAAALGQGATWGVNVRYDFQVD
jgi:iron complex outermembrane recepter protein